MYPIGPIRPGVPGDNALANFRPEIIAAEARILSCVDAMLTFMRKIEITDPEAKAKLDAFMTHMGGNPLRGNPLNPDAEAPRSLYVLEKMDRDMNRLMLDLMRAAFERRCWQLAYHERESLDAPRHYGL